MSAPSSNAVPEMNLPSQYWNAISQDDRNEFIHLRNNFHHGQKISSKDRRIITFSKELSIVLRYLERSDENREERCVLCGVCFVGPIVCVNTRQLKSFLSRCKSSINGSFQQLGFVALRTKAKARNCVLTALPSLQNHQSILRQWTVRYASDEARFCFVSSYSKLKMPEITPEDLFDEKKPTPRRTQSSGFYLHPNSQQMAPQFQFGINQAQQQQTQFQGSSPLLSPQQQNSTTMINNFSNPLLSAPRPPVSFQPKQIDFELSSIDDFDPMEPPNGLDSYNNFSLSVSYECLQDIDVGLNPPPLTLDDDMDSFSVTGFPQTEKSMTRSQSAFVWDPLSDNLF
ncbi:hypothetical protein M9Y10_041935 [Tritrichomonas musculus]|uniref:Initiator binding domain-containing protein n=1 Tax=Tritrichomonas musculus TaxID=1915356 RepID=A0ABR2K7J5_9EUKA